MYKFTYPENKAVAEIVNRLKNNAPLITRLSLACILSYSINHLLFNSADLTGSIAALLVVQATVYKTFSTAFERVIAVIFGVSLAIAVSSWFGIGVTSLAIVVITSLIVSTVFAFHDNFLEVPISGMLILAASQHGVASEMRLINTLIGAGVGISILLLFPMKPKLITALEAVSDVADAAAEQTEAIADSLTNNDFSATMLLKKIHFVQPQVEEAKKTIADVRQGYLLNYSAVRDLKGHELDLMQALSALEDCLPHLQKLIISLDSRAYSTIDKHHIDPEIINEMKGIYSSSLLTTAQAIRAFGDYFDAPLSLKNEKMKVLASAHRHLKASEEMLSEFATIPNIDDSSVDFIMSMLKTMSQIGNILDVDGISIYNMTTKKIFKDKFEVVNKNTIQSATTLKRNLKVRTNLKKVYFNNRGRVKLKSNNLGKMKK